MQRISEILAVGGGPAGCIAAIGLARAGHAVALATSPRPRRAVEGLSERVLRALEHAGCTEALAAIGPAVRREVTWNDDASAPNREWVVDRGRFDRALLADAARHGVAVAEGHARSARREAGGWRLATSSGTAFRGRFLIEARGRRAPGARLQGPPTTALARSWTGVPRRARTAVASFADGWAWFATTGDGRGTVQLVLASETVPKRDGLPPFFAATLARIGPARDWLAGGRPEGAIVARHAATSRAQRPIEDGLVRVGDAALALDPLSGHGVFEAIASATAAVPVVNTLLRRPEDAALAQSFYEERVGHAHLRFARIGRDFHRLERRFAARPFWRDRAAWPDDEAAHAPASAAEPEIAERAVVADGLIVRRRVIVTADHPRGVWQVEGVPLVELLERRRAGGGDDCATVAGRLERPAAAIETALAWLRYRRLID